MEHTGSLGQQEKPKEQQQEEKTKTNKFLNYRYKWGKGLSGLWHRPHLQQAHRRKLPQTKNRYTYTDIRST